MLRCEKQDNNKMETPSNTSLPFFTYGIFKPGQLGWFRLCEYVERIERSQIRGRLFIRDGLPLLQSESPGSVEGFTLFFKAGMEEEAYSSIGQIEPDHQYRWNTVGLKDSLQTVNLLEGVSPTKGSHMLDGVRSWDGRNDPLFITTLEIIEESLQLNSDEWDIKHVLRLQMAYLLLWSAIERYASIKYHLKTTNVVQKIIKVAEEKEFAEVLQHVVKENRTVIKDNNPKSGNCTLDPSLPKKSILYYYQIRNNAVHKGKALYQDYAIVKSSLIELTAIFRALLEKSFKEIALPE